MRNNAGGLRVLHLSSWGVPCGIANYCRSLVESLAEIGVESDVYPLSMHEWATYLPGDIGRLRDEIVTRAELFDLVHVQHEHGLFGVVSGARAAARNYGAILQGLLSRHKPVVTTFHTPPLDQLSKKRRRFPGALRLLKNWSRAVTWKHQVARHFQNSGDLTRALVHSAITRRAFADSGIPIHALRMVPIGCPPLRTSTVTPALAKERLGLPPQTQLVTLFGFVGRYKGHDLALQALQQLPGDFHLAICGGSHPEARDDFFAEVFRMIARLGLEERVKVTGWLSPEDADLYYAATDICLAPYQPDCGLSGSGAITWALASGRPTIASKIDAFMAIQRESPCMLMTTAGQTEELVWAIRKIADDRALGRELVAAAGEYCRRHSWKNVALATRDIYGEVLHAGTGRSTVVPAHPAAA
ncbi:MAG: glycosyltransferase [Planctomycetota bacterium]|nr:MAG: glycosyltransferase [Planctomycetota bacterium]